MSVEQNKTTALRWSQELWSQGKLAVADEIIAPDYEPLLKGVSPQQMTLRRQR